jgi:hypothetical protein
MDTIAARRLCEAHMHRYVEIRMHDGRGFDGIVEHIDNEVVCLAVPGAIEETRAFFPFLPFAPYGAYPFYPYPRRFRRLVLPLAGLAALSLLPYYW